MKIDAKVTFSAEVVNELKQYTAKVPVDIDYVEDNADSIHAWVANELENMFGRPFMNEDFEITNMYEIIEEIKFNDFEDKIN